MADSIVAEVEYRDIPGFEDYRVGNDGSVWSKRRRHWRKLKPKVASEGYRYVSISTSPGMPICNHKIHRLVLLAFVGPCPDGHETRHKDGVRSNNALNNLCWGTKRENEADKLTHGTLSQGSKSWLAKLSEKDIPVIRKLHARGVTQRTIAESFGVCQKAISLIVRRENWSHI